MEAGLSVAGWVRVLAVVAAAEIWAAPARARPADVWLDVDTANGVVGRDVDDGLALIQAFRSRELVVRGISTTYGNIALEHADRLTRDVVARFGSPDMRVHRGATSSADLGKPSEAVYALARALAKQPLTILALGPATNIASLIALNPHLVKRIQAVVLVAGRRPGQSFYSTPDQRRPFRDFNFELDPHAVKILLESNVHLVLAGWEVAAKVWMTRDDLRTLSTSGNEGAWISRTSQSWLLIWETMLNAPGFNPFDTLAVGYVAHPELIRSVAVKAWIEHGPDDTGARKSKPYLLVAPDPTPTTRRITYCYQVEPEFKSTLLVHLSARPETRTATNSTLRVLADLLGLCIAGMTLLVCRLTRTRMLRRLLPPPIC